MYCSSNASLAKYLQKLQANVAENYVKLHNFLTILYQGSRDQSGQAIKLFQLGWSKIVLPSLPFLTQVFHPWWCETRDSYPTTVLNERMWHFRGGVSEHTLTPPTYFHGVKTPNPRIYAPPTLHRSMTSSVVFVLYVQCLPICVFFLSRYRLLYFNTCLGY